MKSINENTYPAIIFEKEPSDKYHVVYIPDIDSVTYGKDLFDCMEMARDLLGITWLDRTYDGLEFPKPFTTDNRYPSGGEDFVIKYSTLIDIDFDKYRNELEKSSC